MINNRSPKSLGALFACAMFAVFACGCSGPSAERMVPEVEAAAKTIAGSLRVMEVVGEKEESFGGPSYVTSEQLREALVLTLRESGLFGRVELDRGELELHTTVHSQGQKVSRVLQYTGTMVVTYRILDRAGNIVWAESYDTEFSSTAFAGSTRTVRAREGSARENLASLIDGLRKGWPSR